MSTATVHGSDSPRIDAHCHLWSLERGDYHWMDVNDPSLKKIARNFEISHLKEAWQTSNISQAILVQAAATEEETEFLLDIAEKNLEIAGVVGWVDLASEHAFNHIDRFAENPYFKGIRPMLQDIEDTNWLIKVPNREIWQHLAKHGLRFDALIKPRHLDLIYQFCIDHPELPIVIDHVAKPEFISTQKESLTQTYEKIAAIGKQTHAYCKLSGLLTEMELEQCAHAYDILKPLVDQLIQAFGPNRIMWGSDWPVVRLAGDYGFWNELTLELLKDLDQSEQDAILFKTAQTFYGLEV